jgi:hypothetical protein
MTDAVAVPIPGIIVPGNVDFSQLIEGADVTTGSTLETELDWLLNYPFAVVGLNFREGIQRPISKTEKERTNYVSVEIVLASGDVLKRARKLNIGQRERYTEGERLVFNDGSTGIYRQLCAWLEAKKVIQFPDGESAGSSGTSRYDTYRDQWTILNSAYASWSPAADGKDDADTLNITGMVLFVKGGLRDSAYQNDFGDAKTRYLS